jgi:hypothetical protein
MVLLSVTYLPCKFFFDESEYTAKRELVGQEENVLGPSIILNATGKIQFLDTQDRAVQL